MLIFNETSKWYILGSFLLVSSKFLTEKCEIRFKTSWFCSKHSFYEMFQNRSIRHIQMGIRHMWWVANGLDNAGLNKQLKHLNAFESEHQTKIATKLL